MRAAHVLVLAVLASASSACASGGAPDAAASPSPLLDQAGRGPVTTGSFDTDRGWDVSFMYDCSGADSPWFLLRVQRDGQSVNVLGEGVAERGQGTSRWPHGGTYSLEVDTECDWTVRVS